MGELSQAMQHKALNLNNLRRTNMAEQEGALFMPQRSKDNNKKMCGLDLNVIFNILILATVATAGVGAASDDSGGLRWAVFVLALLTFLFHAYKIYFFERESVLSTIVVLLTFTAAVLALVYAIHSEYSKDNLWVVFVLDILCFGYMYILPPN